MGRGRGQQEDRSNNSDIQPWLWQRPWKVLRSPWRFMKTIPYCYFAEIFLPLHKPWGPFRFPEGPGRWNLTLKWEELKRKQCFTVFWRRWAIYRSICGEASQPCYHATVPALTTHLSQESPVHFKISLMSQPITFQVWVSKYLHVRLLTKHRILDECLDRAGRNRVTRGGENTEMFGFTPC